MTVDTEFTEALVAYVRAEIALHDAKRHCLTSQGPMDAKELRVANAATALQMATKKLREPEPAPRDIQLPWEVLHQKWQWAARDESGFTYLYQGKPQKGHGGWIKGEGRVARADNLLADFAPGTKPWDQSLIRRPEAGV